MQRLWWIPQRRAWTEVRLFRPRPLPYRVAVAERRRLLHKSEARGKCAGSLREAGDVACRHHHDEAVDAGEDDLFDQDLKGGFGRSILVNQGLKGQPTLGLAGGGNEGLLDLHAKNGVGDVGIRFPLMLYAPPQVSNPPSARNRQSPRADTGSQSRPAKKRRVFIHFQPEADSLRS